MVAGRPSRPDFDPDRAREEIRTIARELRCSAVRVQGQDPARLRLAAEFALDEGMTVYFSPLKHDVTTSEALTTTPRGPSWPRSSAAGVRSCS
ncbi:hypothetical protein LWP59_28225 [Amycolatopsis acidiphila]|uniref:Uncharacterized protein n=1 Tax=Amycolatopsis acidiphila TaxID=715473 RepID=A0A558ADF1_9PSEU|nr:hypothetical protein [Amycolatopsis acidiphila]TVT22291.1 hypothetical protein FNH06_14015 [Amycolatopsis acidiphila]UIJ57994.1 hypothetical protein LWP59_28225 [Amycolatopsis acidiphila]GHG70651.1 hypothetical protein GCM10017788_31970 [Amycolatopsis acidiphila]